MLLYSLQNWLASEYSDIEFFVTPSQAVTNGILLEYSEPQDYTIAANTYQFFFISIRFVGFFEEKNIAIQQMQKIYNDVKIWNYKILPATQAFDFNIKSYKIENITVDQGMLSIEFLEEYNQLF